MKRRNKGNSGLMLSFTYRLLSRDVYLCLDNIHTSTRYSDASIDYIWIYIKSNDIIRKKAMQKYVSTYLYLSLLSRIYCVYFTYLSNTISLKKLNLSSSVMKEISLFNCLIATGVHFFHSPS